MPTTSDRATWTRPFWERTSEWASRIATRNDNNEVWIFISVYLPCTGRRTPASIEATNEIEVTAMEAASHSHMIIAGTTTSASASMADGVTIGPNIIKRDAPYTGRAIAVRALW